MDENNLIDLSYLEQVCSGNKALVAKMIDLFIQQTPLQMEKLWKHSSNGDWHEFFNVAHKVKSSLAMMGVKSLESSMESLEAYSKNKIELHTVPDLLKHVENTCKHILKEIENNYSTFDQ